MSVWGCLSKNYTSDFTELYTYVIVRNVKHIAQIVVEAVLETFIQDNLFIKCIYANISM